MAACALLGFHCSLTPFELEGFQAQQLVAALRRFVPRTLTRLPKTTSHTLLLSTFGLSSRSLRHDGAFHDLLHEMRPLAAGKRRGRWLANPLLRPYSRETKMIETFARILVRTLDRIHALCLPLKTMIWRPVLCDVLRRAGTT